MPRLRANRFMVPAGRMASAFLLSISLAAAAETVPSPPPARTTSARPVAALSSAAISSSPETISILTVWPAASSVSTHADCKGIEIDRPQSAAVPVQHRHKPHSFRSSTPRNAKPPEFRASQALFKRSAAREVPRKGCRIRGDSGYSGNDVALASGFRTWEFRNKIGGATLSKCEVAPGLSMQQLGQARQCNDTVRNQVRGELS